ncbi:MAG: hypothetical protein F6K34_28855, partial [Okeania sp. SIO4D6]|nr:hypothetical protein [Okeania sp. SIO4D6]
TLEYTVLDDLSQVMSKRPFYKMGNVEAMNILLDKAQGTFRPIPIWVTSTSELLRYRPQAALIKALAGSVTEADTVRRYLLESIALQAGNREQNWVYSEKSPDGGL